MERNQSKAKTLVILYELHIYKDTNLNYTDKEHFPTNHKDMSCNYICDYNSKLHLEILSDKVYKVT